MDGDMHQDALREVLVWQLPGHRQVHERINELVHTLDGSHPAGDLDPGHGVAAS